MGNSYDHLSDREVMLLTAQKVDFMANEFLEARRVQTKVCETHQNRTTILERNVGTWLTFRQRFIGAWWATKLSVKVGTPILAAIWAGVKWYSQHRAQGGHGP